MNEDKGNDKDLNEDPEKCENGNGKSNEKFEETDPLNEERKDTNLGPKGNYFKRTWERLKYIKQNITVEPIMACHVMPSVLSRLATQNLNLEKACRVNLGYSQEVCEALKIRQTEHYRFEEESVQKLTASVQVWRNIIVTALPCLLILFVGGWSDKTGKRKVCILIPLFGEFLTVCGLLVNTYFMYELPLEVAALTESLIPALTGGWFCMFVGAFSYIADVTTESERTYRVGVLNMCMTLGVPIGTALSGVLLNLIGYYGVFSTSAVLYAFGLIYGIKFIKETPRARQIEMENANKEKISFWKNFFDFNYVKETMVVAFKNGPRRRRLRVILLMICMCVVYGPMHGEHSIFYLFMRYRFNWNEVQYSMFSTYNIITHLIGTFISITVFSEMLKCDDTVLGIISSTSKICGAFVYAFARTTLEIYMGPLVEILNATSFTAMRSIASKLVPSQDLGKVNSLFGLAEAMMPLVYGPLYARIYMETLEILPGAVFLLGAVLTLPAIFIFCWLYKEVKLDQKLNKGNDTEIQNRNLQPVIEDLNASCASLSGI